MKILKKIKYFFIKKIINYKYKKFIFKIAETNEEISNSFHLRYKVYCIENNYLDKNKYSNKKEFDNFDKFSTHFIALNKKNEVVGSIRLIHYSNLGLRIQDYVNLSNINVNKLSELSRLVVDKAYRNENHIITLGLCKEAYKFSMVNGIQYWCGTMFLYTIKLFYSMHFFFNIIGKLDYWPKESNNPIFPILFDLKDTAIYLKVKNPKLYNFFVHNGHEFKLDDKVIKDNLDRIIKRLDKEKNIFESTYNKYYK